MSEEVRCTGLPFVPSGYFYKQFLFVKSSWIRDLLENQSLPIEFPCHPNYSPSDVTAILKDGKVPKGDIDRWEILSVDRYHRNQQHFVCQLPGLNPKSYQDNKPCFAEIVQYVTQANFANNWREAFKKFPSTLIGDSNKSSSSSQSTPIATYDSTLLEVLYRLYNCLIIDVEDNIEPLASDENDPILRNVVKAVVCLIAPTEVLILRRLNRYSVHNLLRFSPALVENSYLKPLFISYQMLIAVNEIHKRGLIVGDISLDDVFIDDHLYVSILSQPTANLLKSVSEPSDDSSITFQEKRLPENLRSLLSNFKKQLSQSEDVETVCDNFLGNAVHLWVTCQLSNFDYILLLNYLSGRTFANPNHYPVMPWIRDFTTQNGGWRDLSKSKYRLNKGDTQLDLTYESVKICDPSQDSTFDPLGQQKAVTHIPHHVSDVLSEITYYVYKARQTPKSVLCKYVRNRWVPAEYPSSMQRLMEWTPDECIPEFFTDAEIFNSVHEDLADLELPSWCESKEDFIQWHRECLESQRVSEKLHSWIDLTFGYKLSGSSAVRAKNVCLNLVDGHTDLRDGGQVQVFNSPHPTRLASNPYWDPKKAPNLTAYLNGGHLSEDSESENEGQPTTPNAGSKTISLNEEPTLNSKAIGLPKNFDALSLIQDTEHLDVFIAKNHSDRERSSMTNSQEKRSSSLTKVLQTRRMIRDMQVMGCLILELFTPKKFLSLSKDASLKSRYDLARTIIQQDQNSVPHCIRYAVTSLLKPSSTPFDITDEDRYPIINTSGHPPPSAFQFLMPIMSDFHFPTCFETFARILRVHQDIEESEVEAKRYSEKWTSEAEDKVADVTSKTLASDLLPIIEDLTGEELTVIMPKLRYLYSNPSTAITMAWLTFEPLAKQLGPQEAIENLLQPIIDIYENNAQTSKHLKLYHRTFLCNVMVRFSLRVFLKYFTENLIEAVGGYKDFSEDRQGLERNWTIHDQKDSSSTNGLDLNNTKTPSKSDSSSAKTPNEEFTEGEVFAFDNEEEPSRKSGNFAILDDVKADIDVPSAHDISTEALVEALANSDKIGKLSEGNISQVASESVIWLAHRLGPVLTAKYISKNLLKMLNLCYVGPKSSLLVNDIKQQDFIIRVQSVNKTQGDVLAHNVLECLTEIASIFGENFILLQYLPYAWDLIALSKKRLTPNLEGGLIGCVSMAHHMVPYLNDSILMNELTENFMNRLLFPVLQLVTSRSVTFSGGWRPRKVLLGKLLDVTYLIGLRIGEEMARTHLTPLISAFFSAFDKVYDEEGKSLSSEEEQDALKELQEVLNPEFANACYVAFYHLMGRAHLDMTIPNLKLLKFLCSRYPGSPMMLATFAHLRPAALASGPNDLHSSASSGGNKIMSSHDSGSIDDPSQEIHGLIKKDVPNSTRHLRGNWLAYWEHEIGRAEKDSLFSFKQIKLQTFQGHTSNIKSFYVLDNENSFLSASRDKTVKVWSLRSQGDGTATVNPQWSYGMHKKSVMSVYFLDNINLAVSCDTSIHIWDPFVGTGVHQVCAKHCCFFSNLI